MIKEKYLLIYSIQITLKKYLNEHNWWSLFMNLKKAMFDVSLLITGHDYRKI